MYVNAKKRKSKKKKKSILQPAGGTTVGMADFFRYKRDNV